MYKQLFQPQPIQYPIVIPEDPHVKKIHSLLSEFDKFFENSLDKRVFFNEEKFAELENYINKNKEYCDKNHFVNYFGKPKFLRQIRVGLSLSEIPAYLYGMKLVKEVYFLTRKLRCLKQKYDYQPLVDYSFDEYFNKLIAYFKNKFFNPNIPLYLKKDDEIFHDQDNVLLMITALMRVYPNEENLTKLNTLLCAILPVDEQGKKIKSPKLIDDIAKCDDRGQTALHNAVYAGNLDAVRLLLIGCKVDDDSLKKLLNAQNEDGNTPLHVLLELTEDYDEEIKEIPLEKLRSIYHLLMGNEARTDIVNNQGKTAEELKANSDLFIDDEILVDSVPLNPNNNNSINFRFKRF